ncbi:MULTISPECIES: hypothetical protein [unclassified Arcicella]|uniref:hypothetical protein n=1 Tax=unclassified Arcicella TaxID=2644986 RepID=UPI002865DACD|nr:MULTISPECIES: hypothetical protein [unclassified Arcicella]MDR6563268.1 myosin heavy subunit [Arcicella sp. BE51]MDR6811581.1 myosin heavy subunit [Arcicella sp. BE140]MDR6823107.1 myosin heavy subunit [Arcicella sp. BE139]
MNNLSSEELTPKPNTNNILRAVLVLVVLIAGCLAYMLFESKETSANQQEVINTKVMELAETRVKLDSITTQLEAQIEEVEKLGGDVSELQKAKAALEKDKSELTKRYATLENIKENYADKIKNYESILIAKEAELVQLRDENSSLTNENSTLKNEKNGLTKSVEEARAQNKEVSSINKILTEKVTRAAALRAESIKIIGITEKGKEFEDDRYKSKKLGKIKIAVQLNRNDLTEKGKKTVLIRILDPDGYTLFDTDLGSGNFEYNGQDLAFTIRRDMTFDNENLHAEFYFDRGAPYRPGKYTVEVFTEGFKIGTGGFEVK